MNQIEMINKLKMVIGMIVIIILVSCYFNNFHTYPIKDTDLEIKLLEELQADQSKGEILFRRDAAQSRTYIFLKGDKKGCATYVKSLYTNKWRQSNFYIAQENELKLEYSLKTQLLEYKITCVLEGENAPNILLSEEAKPVLITKTFVIGIILAAWFAGRMIGLAQQKKKKY